MPGEKIRHIGPEQKKKIEAIQQRMEDEVKPMIERLALQPPPSLESFYEDPAAWKAHWNARESAMKEAWGLWARLDKEMREVVEEPLH